MIVYISIGNSDDKLLQSEWAEFVGAVDYELQWSQTKVHGRWFSAPDVRWQSACWCIEYEPTLVLDNSPHYQNADGEWVLHTSSTRQARATLMRKLGRLAVRWRQDSISWAEVPNPQFLTGRTPK